GTAHASEDSAVLGEVAERFELFEPRLPEELPVLATRQYAAPGRKAVRVASEEARLLGQPLGGEHLVVGMLEPGSVAFDALSTLGLTQEQARAELTRRPPTPKPMIATKAFVTPAANRV